MARMNVLERTEEFPLRADISYYQHGRTVPACTLNSRLDHAATIYGDET